MNGQSRIVMLVVAALLALGVIAGQAQETTRSKVPTLTGLSVTEAKAAAVKAGFVAKFELGEPSKTADEALTVYAQSPAAGAELVRGGVVKLTIYAAGNGSAKSTTGDSSSRTGGPQPDGKVKVPSFIGQSSKEISAALRGMGLVPKFQLGSDAPTEEKALIAYEQEPKSGTAVARGSEVRITIHARRGGESAVATKNADGSRAVPRKPLELTQVSATPFLDLSNEQIEPRTGELQLTATDLIVAAGPVNLEVQRAFQSLSRKPGLLGTRWQLNWESRLVKNGKWATIEQASRVVIFSPDTRSKQYRTPAGDSLAVGKDASVWTKPDGSREVFDRQGRLIEQDRRNGNKVTLQYDTLGRLARVEGPFQSFLNFVTDAEGRLTRIESSTGAMARYDYEEPAPAKAQARDESTVGYGYDASGMLTRIDHPRFGQTQYSYDKKMRVTGHRWADGTSDRIEHDDATRTRRHTDAAGAVSTMQWSADGRRVELTNPLGHKIVTENDA
ncbi:MAG: PASTA domain-containing protein, partial [Planctomycetaceae bacterium]|nr:PASTA domain-containing protein [Planctomycetaceae bacterium]